MTEPRITARQARRIAAEYGVRLHYLGGREDLKEYVAHDALGVVPGGYADGLYRGQVCESDVRRVGADIRNQRHSALALLGNALREMGR